MIRLLYIPNGQYMVFYNEYDAFTENIEESPAYVRLRSPEAFIAQVIKEVKEINGRYSNASISWAKQNQVYDIPNMTREEFEIIYD